MYQDHDETPGTLEVTVEFEPESDREVRARATLDMTAKVRLELPFDLPEDLPLAYSLKIEPEEDTRAQAETFQRYLRGTLQTALETAIEDVLGVRVDLEGC